MYAALVLWALAEAHAGTSVAGQGEWQLGLVRSAEVDGVGTDDRSRVSANGLGLLLGGHGSVIGLMRGNEPGFYVQDWLGGEVGLGAQFGRNGNFWYEFDFDAALRVGMHDDDADLLIGPLVRTGNFRGVAGSTGNANYGFGLTLVFSAGGLVVEAELPKPHRKTTTKGWSEQSALTVGFGENAKYMVRWEYTATGGYGEDPHRARSTTLMFVFRMG